MGRQSELTGVLHLPFSLSASGNDILLSDIIGTDISTIDHVNYSNQAADISYGRYPDASDQFKLFGSPTPKNNNVLPLINNLFINEFLAGNSATNADAFGEFDDWVELYNGGSVAIDVGGLFIVDDLAETSPYQIPTTSPELTTIPPGGFLLLWCDKQTEQGVLHVDIKLSGGGEQIGLLQINGTDRHFIDSLTYLAQTDDISEGRQVDGDPSFVNFTAPTPNSSNNQKPEIAITSITLIDADTDQDLFSITDGMVINVNELPTLNLTIDVGATADVGSLQMVLTGAIQN